jgi:hypothetical protein
MRSKSTRFSRETATKTEAGDRVALRWRTAGSPCIRLGAVLDHEEPLSHLASRSAAIDMEPWCFSPIKAMPPGVRKRETYKVRTYGRNHSFRGIAF